uniref:ATP synthase subunit a n=1 Tax=Ectrychotes andreae TaxID=204515 RepID=A0A7I6HH44_9HEMI|nr:ATP synthase F0 subunit 6 [Ectrychotes andreae]
MMTNLFSTFDPATSNSLSLNWMSMIMPIIFMPLSFWFIPSRFSMLIKFFSDSLLKEFKTLLGEYNLKLTAIFISLFMFILFNNFMGLFPYIFTASSHLSFTLSLSIPLWLSLMIFGWINHTQHMLAHLIPESSPMMLTPFMACIETISNIIRPGSLAVRLAANMIAGHLLMCLLGNNMINMNEIMIPLIMMIQISLILFETAVFYYSSMCILYFIYAMH